MLSFIHVLSVRLLAVRSEVVMHCNSQFYYAPGYYEYSEILAKQGPGPRERFGT